ncbi:hypothetical protein [Candidatus Erwinia haradaeae]|uniref:hypothetical protein n=1 Tax=Candidatus Erwinia haradaeae TaxID=1922217 RepID=UPI0013008503|nr:hypothetical protein [Candidatus Erwinia haradaeae]
MVQKDYISYRREITRYRKKMNSVSPKRNRDFLKVMIIISIILGGLLYALWFCLLYNKKEEILRVVHKDSTVVHTLPPKPIERWYYMKELESQ